MKRGFGIVGTAVTAASLLFWFASSAAGASHSGPHGRRGGRGPTYSVAEPSAIALLGAGLVALGLYAKKKNHKKS